MSTTVARHDVTTAGVPAAVRRALNMQGIFARVARRLHLGPSGRTHVYRVAIGQRQSKRVMEALLAEIARVESNRKEAA